MGTTEQKLDKIKQTKRRLKAVINSLGGGLTESNKFSDYPHALGELYNRLPKTSYQEGTNINLGKTLNAVVEYGDDKVLYGDTSQDSTEGRQLLNIENYDTNYSVYVKEVTNSYMILESRPNISYEQVMYWQDVSLESGTTYYITRNIDVISGTLQSTEGYVELYQGTTWKKILLQNTNSGTFTVDETGTYRIRVRIRIANQSETIKFKIYNFMISKTQGAWEKYTGGIPSPNPSYPQPISVVTGTQNVVVRGKNLTNLGSYNGTINGISVTTEKDIISYNGTTTGNNNITPNGYNYVDLGEFKAGTYSLKLFGLSGTYNTNTKTSAIYLRNGEKQTIINLKMEVLLSEAREFTLATDQHLYFQQYSASGIEYNNFVMGIQIETGSTATTYEPYIEPTTYTLHLGNLELAKIGTYQDYIYFDVDEGKWYKKKVIAKVNYNGSEDWNYNSNNTIFVLTGITLGVFPAYGDKPLILSNYFSAETFESEFAEQVNYGISFGATKADRFCVRNIDVNSPTNFKTWLNTHNLLVYYVLATATDEEITDTTLIQDLDNILAMNSIEGTTIIEVSGNLPANIKVRAIKG